MARWLLVLVGLYAMVVVTNAAVAGSPRFRRFIEEMDESSQPESSNTEIIYCARKTPCAWSMFSGAQIIDMNITNTYCSCAPGTECMINEKDTSTNSYVHRCRLPSEKITI